MFRRLRLRPSRRSGPFRALPVLACCAVLAGCGTVSRAATPADPPTAASPADRTGGTAPTAPPTTAPLLGKAGKWRVTTYYTAVERYHGGERRKVRGCTRLHCKGENKPLGAYPAEFLKIVRMEGSGRISSGEHAGRYLNWATGVGWWLDDSTRDSRGKPLREWSTAAINRDIARRGQRFTVAECGRTGAGTPTAAKVCARFREATWTVRDVFRPGWGGEHRVDLYIGEETGPDFTKSGFYTTLNGATLAVAP